MVAVPDYLADLYQCDKESSHANILTMLQRIQSGQFMVTTTPSSSAFATPSEHSAALTLLWAKEEQELEDHWI